MQQDDAVACPRCGADELAYLNMIVAVDHERVYRDEDGAPAHDECTYWTDYWPTNSLDDGSVVCVGPPDYTNGRGCGARWRSLDELDREVRAQEAPFGVLAITHY
jgi:diadenosine tetraphosphatase ApaH/serine/threonine PP2A family protein phosphatase